MATLGGSGWDCPPIMSPLSTPIVQSVAFAASLAVSLAAGNYVTVAALTGNLTHLAPTIIPPRGVRVAYSFTQDGTGTRTITWSAAHLGGAPTAAGTAGQKRTFWFESDGTNLLYMTATGWY